MDLLLSLYQSAFFRSPVEIWRFPWGEIAAILLEYASAWNESVFDNAKRNWLAVLLAMTQTLSAPGF